MKQRASFIRVDNALQHLKGITQVPPHESVQYIKGGHGYLTISTLASTIRGHVNAFYQIEVRLAFSLSAEGLFEYLKDRLNGLPISDVDLQRSSVIQHIAKGHEGHIYYALIPASLDDGTTLNSQ